MHSGHPKDLSATIAFLRQRVAMRPHVVLVLGSGLGGLADEVADAVRIPFHELPGFASTAVQGHRGTLVAGRLEGVSCIALQGRYHVYEGHGPAAVIRPLRAVAALAPGILIVTNAAGGLNRTFRQGDLMIIADHIDLMGRHRVLPDQVLPTRSDRGAVSPHGAERAGAAHGAERAGAAQASERAGAAQASEQEISSSARELGADLRQTADVYHRELRELALRVGIQERVRVVQGVYCAGTGPSYETPAEVRMLQRLGADAVGMSTVPEAIAARALGLRVLGISLISNAAAGLRQEPLSHEEVVAAGEAASERFGRLIRGTLRALPGHAGGALDTAG